MTSDSISSYGSDVDAAVDPDGDEIAGGRPVHRQEVDTVDRAIAHPGGEQQWRSFGLLEDEYHRIREILGRRPTSCELAMYGVMWREHGSLTFGTVHLRQFGERQPGVVDIGGGWAVTVAFEGHPPSSVEPGQGTKTGIGGIVLDVVSMGARPVAVLDSLRFGDIDHPDTARVVPGVVAGLTRYRSGLGLPTLGGEMVFDPGYQGNPLVSVVCVGTMRRGIQHLGDSGEGNLIVLVGARTGADAVEDPFTGKALIECCLELFGANAVTGVRNLGAAGLARAFSELPGDGDGGVLAHLDRVPLRDSGLRPEAVLTGESPERMVAVVRPDDLATFLTITTKWDVEATVVGEITRTGRLVVLWHGDTVVDVPPHTVALGGPVLPRPIKRPHGQNAIQSEVPDRLARPATGEELRDTLLRLAGSANLASRAWVSEQFDRNVGGNTVLAPPNDAGVLRIDEASGLGIALAVDSNSRFALLDPHAGAQLALAEAYRNVATVGARPIAVTCCLSVGSPTNPGVMWRFEQAVTGLADGCRGLGVPVVGGDVSVDDRIGAAAIQPTPVVGVLGVMDDVARRSPSGWRAAGQAVYLLGVTREELAGSEWAWVVHHHAGGRPPRVDLAAEQRLASVLVEAVRAGVVAGAHDLSDGGLAQALVEASLRYGVGARISLDALCARDRITPFLALFAESAARAVVAVDPAQEAALARLCADREVPQIPLGSTVDEPVLDVAGQFSVSLTELREVHESTLPAALHVQPQPPPSA